MIERAESIYLSNNRRKWIIIADCGICCSCSSVSISWGSARASTRHARMWTRWWLSVTRRCSHGKESWKLSHLMHRSAAGTTTRTPVHKVSHVTAVYRGFPHPGHQLVSGAGWTLVANNPGKTPVLSRRHNCTVITRSLKKWAPAVVENWLYF